MLRQAEKKTQEQETNKPLFHSRITPRQMSQHDIEINYRLPCQISSPFEEI